MKIKVLLFMMLMILGSFKLSAQSMVVEIGYNINGIQYNALCVLDGLSGACHVFCDMGHCWYKAQYSSQSTYKAISVSNPASSGWNPGVFVFTNYGSYVDILGYKYPITTYFVPQKDWQAKMHQYDFSTGRQEQDNIPTYLYEDIKENVAETSEDSSSSDDNTIFVIIVIIAIVISFIVKNKGVEKNKKSLRKK